MAQMLSLANAKADSVRAHDIMATKGTEPELLNYIQEHVVAFERACADVAEAASGLEAGSRKAARQATQSLTDLRAALWAHVHSQLLTCLGHLLYLVFSEASTVHDNEGLLKKEIVDAERTGPADTDALNAINAVLDAGAATASGQDSMPEPQPVYLYNMELLSLLIQAGNGHSAFQDLMAINGPALANKPMAACSELLAQWEALAPPAGRAALHRPLCQVPAPRPCLGKARG